MQPVHARSILLLAPAFVAGTAAVAAASNVDALALRLALQAAAVAAFIAMAWRAGAIREPDDEPTVVALAPAQAAALASDRRRPTFDRETGLCANWYFRLRVEEEIARASRYGQPFTVMSLIGTTQTALDVPRLSLKHWLRQVDFAGDLGNAIAVVLPNTDRAGAATVMDRLTKLVTNVDVRIAEYPVDGATLSQLLGDDEWRVTDGLESAA
jgi:GGDEF domain-containing protein